jgi:hypothetical protein
MFEQFLSNFSGGEVSEEIYGRFDSELYKNSLRRCQNFISLIQGPAQYRAGFSYVHSTKTQQVARLERFRYTDEQVYVLEFTNAKLRIYEDAALTVNSTSKDITGVSIADPCVITCVGHSFSTGDEVYIDGVVGTTELNGRFFRIVNLGANSFSLKDLFGIVVDSSAFTAYDSAGTATIVYELTSPFLLADLFEFQFDQEGNVAYFVHRSYAPYKLTRVSATSWTFATYSRTADVFTTTDLYPGAVAFYEGCLYFASSITYPDRIWRSRGPEATGATRYDDFTTGTDADHAIITAASTGSGDIAFIHWLAGLQKFICVGTEGGVLGLDGGGDAAITPTNFRIRPIDPVGVQGIMPVINGQSIFYMQKGSRILRSFDYDVLLDNYKSTDRQFLAPHLTSGGIKQLAIQRWKTDILWAVRTDGVLLGLTIKPKEDVSGWHQHRPGGSGKVLSVAVEPQVSGYDRLYAVIERTINGVTTRYVEYMNEPYEGVRYEDYFTDDETVDYAAYLVAVYAALDDVVYLDAALTYDDTATATITGLWHLEGETVSVVADGRIHADVVVSDGTITLDRTASVVHVGYKYRGILIPLNLIVVGQVQNSIAFGKSVSTIALIFSHGIGVKYGTSLYNLQQIAASEMGGDTDSPPIPVTGVMVLPFEDSWSSDKHIVYVQDDAYPCMLNGMSVTLEVGEK